MNKRSLKKYRIVNYTSKILAVVLIAIGFTACKTGKQPRRSQVKIIDSTKMKDWGLANVDSAKAATITQAPAAPTQPTPPAINAEKQALIERLTPLYKQEIPFNTFSGKAKMHFKGKGQNQEFTTNFRIKKDLVIWASVSALGGIVNVARLYITPDSIFLVNYLQKQAHKMPISDANKLLPAKVDFGIMQNLILGNVLQQGGKPTDATEFGGTVSIEAEQENIIQQATYNKADNTLRSLQMRTKDNTTQGLIQYGNYENIAGRNFSRGRAINLTNEGEPYYLDMEFNDVTFDQNLEFPFSIPKNYTLK